MNIFHKHIVILCISCLFCVVSCNNTSTVEDAEVLHTEQAVYSTIATYDNNSTIRLDMPLETNYNIVFLSLDKLRLLRNEYYARAGYVFHSQDLTDYFSVFDWYTPSTSNTDSINESFSDIYLNNISFIKKIESQLSSFEKRNELLPSTFIYKDSSFFSYAFNDTIFEFLLEKDFEITTYKMVNFTDLKYCTKVYDVSSKNKQLLRIIQGIDVDFNDVNLDYGNKLFYKTSNTLCCGGPDISRYYNFNTDKLFLIYNDAFSAQIKKEGAPALWVGMIYNINDEIELDNTLKSYGFSINAPPIINNYRFLLNLFLADEENIHEVIDIYLSEELFENSKTKYCLYSLNNADLKVDNIEFDKKNWGYNFKVVYEICNVKKEFIFNNNSIKPDKSTNDDIVYLLREKHTK